MATYQNSIANLGVKLEITHASPDIANNRTTITYKASVYKTGSHNPWNGLSQTPMYLTINGQSLHSTASGNYDLRGGTYQQVIKTGTLVIPHNTDGSKSFTFSWNVNFTSTGYGYKNVTTSGTYVLPNIARASTFTIPSTTITTGSAFTVTINKASDGFRHKVAYIVGSSENEWITNANTTYSATIPHSLFNAYKSVDSVAGVIRVTTMNGTTVVGSNQTAVTINLISSAKPTLEGVSYTNGNKGMFSGTNQFIRNVSLPTITAGTTKGSYSSTISSYEFQTLRNGTVLETISKTANSQQFGAFNFPSSGSEAKVYMQARVRDSRGRYSGWVKTPELRVHHYAPPAIGTMTVRRTGSANTTLQVTRNYTVTNMYEGGGATNSNTASLTFQHRTKGSTTATNNTGAGSTTMFLTNSNANLSGTFAANTSYEVRAILKDKLNTVYGSWISVGTEFVPMDIGPKGIGVGRIHDNGAYDLQVGSGGIKTDGHLIASAGAQVTGSLVASGGLGGNHINITGNGGNVQALNTFYNPSNGLLIDICGHQTYNMITVYVQGNGYAGIPINSIFQTYHYDSVGNFLNTKQINFGDTMHAGVFFVHGTRIKLWIAATTPYKTFTVTATGMNGAIYNVGLSNSGFPGSITYRSNCQVYKSWHEANDGSGSGLDADLLDGLHASDIKAAQMDNSNGYSLRFPNGVQIIGGKKTFSSVSDPSITFPQAFAATPNVSLLVEQSNRWLRVMTSLTTLNNSGLTASVIDFDAKAVANFTLHYYAIGRWKVTT